MPKGIKASSLKRMEANAAKFGEAAKKALAKSAEARKDASEKVVAFEKAVKAALKEAKAALKSGGSPTKRIAAKKTPKTSTKKVGVKGVAVKTAARMPAKKATAKVAKKVAR